MTRQHHMIQAYPTCTLLILSMIHIKFAISFKHTLLFSIFFIHSFIHFFPLYLVLCNLHNSNTFMYIFYVFPSIFLAFFFHRNIKHLIMPLFFFF
jgi:hypothetical protein